MEQNFVNRNISLNLRSEVDFSNRVVLSELLRKIQSNRNYIIFDPMALKFLLIISQMIPFNECTLTTPEEGIL